MKSDNIILVGMPGSGKTTIGKEVAELLQREFIDLDEYIASSTGKTPAQWILENEEAAFRDIETKALKEIFAQPNIVLSVGGGAVLKEENRRLMQQSGKIYWIKRAISLLETSGRPLSVDLNCLYETRKPLYAQVSDIQIENGTTPIQAALKIQNDFLKKQFNK